jgi:hypothetical protein
MGVSQPIYRAALGRWKRDLPKETKELFSESANDLLIMLDYAEDDRWMNEKCAAF